MRRYSVCQPSLASRCIRIPFTFRCCGNPQPHSPLARERIERWINQVFFVLIHADKVINFSPNSLAPCQNADHEERNEKGASYSHLECRAAHLQRRRMHTIESSILLISHIVANIRRGSSSSETERSDAPAQWHGSHHDCLVLTLRTTVHLCAHFLLDPERRNEWE